MGIIRKKKLVSSNLTKIKKAKFVSTEIDATEKFKYNFRYTTNKYINDNFVAFKNACNKIKQNIQLKLDKFDFVAARGAVSIWLAESFIEGLIVNFSVWGLLGWKFNFITIMAWGFAVKQLLDIYWRLRINGSNTTIPEKH